MADSERQGVLRWEQTESGKRLRVHDSEGPVRTVTNLDKFLHPDLRALPDTDLEGTAVEYLWGGGQAKRIRPAGQAWPVAPSPTATGTERAVETERFANPYTFVPAPPRDLDDPELGDHEPAGQDRLHDSLWTGRITVRMGLATPLLTLDAARARPYGGVRGHLAYPLALLDGQPYVAPTAIKGMLRAAYETATNSRFGVFPGHETRLAQRAPASDGLRCIPARVSDGNLVLLPGTSPLGSQNRTRSAPLHAAWLPAYKSRTSAAVRGNPRPGNRDDVEAWVELVHHHGRDRSRQLVHDFDFWQVTELAPAGADALSSTAPPVPSVRRPDRGSWFEPTGTTMKIRGWLCRTNESFSRKHDERVLFVGETGQPPPRPIPITEEMRNIWRAVIGSYRDAHSYDEIWGRTRKDGSRVEPWVCLGTAPGQTAWSRHLYEDGELGEADTASWDELSDDLLLYVTLDSSFRHVEQLSPVMVGRHPYRSSPWDLLHPSLRPATSRSRLSPADRVFGWVGKEAHRGQLRVGPVDVVAAEMKRFDPPIPLAILGQPKPQQARFYVAHDERGSPLERGAPKARSYQQGQSLRGRKVYPHHAGLSDAHWDPPVDSEGTQELLGGRYREYLRPRAASDDRAPKLSDDGRAFVTTTEQRDSQNRSIDGWVAPGSEFQFDVEVTNLSDVELGALLWLLQLGPKRHHRLGLGKPLGFGSVVLSVVSHELETGKTWRQRWAMSENRDKADDPWSTVARFQAAVAKTATFENVPHISALLAASEGQPGLPVHYPRVRPVGMSKAIPTPPDPRGRGFEWFVLNERPVQGRIVEGRSLPAAGQPPLEVYDAPEDRRR